MLYFGAAEINLIFPSLEESAHGRRKSKNYDTTSDNVSVSSLNAQAYVAPDGRRALNKVAVIKFLSTSFPPLFLYLS